MAFSWFIFYAPAQSDEYRLLHVTQLGAHDKAYECPPRVAGLASAETIGLWLTGGPGAGSFRRLYRLLDVSDAEAPSPAQVAAYCATHGRAGHPGPDLQRLRALAAQASQPLLAPH